MSAWLCENKLLSLVVDVVKSDSFKEYDIEGKYRDKSELDLMRCLSEINSANLYYLYPNDDEFNVLKDISYVNLEASDIQKHKSVCSFIYQSCDCEENEHNELFNLLSRWSEDYREVYSGIEWDEAEWDIDNPLNISGVC